MNTYKRKNREYHISLCLAEFSDAVMEEAFQKSVQSVITRQLRTALMVWGILLLIFAMPDYQALGLSRSFFYLLAYRLIMVFVILILYFVITPATSIFKISIPVSLVLIGGYSGFLLFFVYRPDVVQITLGVLSVQLISMMMFIPIRFIMLIFVAVYGVLITLITRYVMGTSPVRLFGLFIILILPVAAGAATAIRYNILNRRQFALLTSQNVISEALRKSEKSLDDAQARAHLGSFEVDFKNNKLAWSKEMFSIYGVDPKHGPLNIAQFNEAAQNDDEEMTSDNEVVTSANNKDILKKEYKIIRRSDGAVRWLESYYDTVSDGNGDIISIAGTAQDITERKLAEEKINQLLKEKDLLLKEVHHRVKNNMNIMMSLLSLQADNMDDPGAASALMDARVRMQSMSVLYDKLYRSENFNEMSIKDYLPPLVDEIVAMFPKRAVIKVSKNMDDFKLPYKTLSAIGILSNEIITNILKHAFNGRDNGEITVSFSVAGKLASFIIQDNGVGIPENVDLHNSNGFGLQLVDMLAQQIGGKVALDRENGTRFKLEFTV